MRSGVGRTGYVRSMTINTPTEPPHSPEPTLEGYEALVHELESLSTEELRARAEAKDIDGADTMKREQLIEKLKDSPGANEI